MVCKQSLWLGMCVTELKQTISTHFLSGTAIGKWDKMYENR